jgi:hypothetical protein
MPICYWSEVSYLSFLAITSDTHNGDREELRSGLPVQYWNNWSQLQNLGSTSGEVEHFAQYFFKN